MAQTRKQAKAPVAANKVNGEEIVRQLEALLDQYERLDKPTRDALERVFKKYKDLCPGFIEAGTKKVASLIRPKTQPAAPAVTLEAGHSDEMAKMLEDHASLLRQKCLEAEKAFAEAKALYEYQKTVYSVYEETVFPFIEPFKKLMENLVYFAACADPAVYEEGKTPLQNRSRALRNAVQPGMWAEHLDAAHLDRIGEMFAVEKKEADFHFREEDGTAPDRARAYKDRTAAADAQRKPYAKLANRIRQAGLLWEYVALLRCFLPQLEKITAAPEEEESAQWATEIGESLLAGVKSHTCRNSSMKFLWVYPHGPLSRRNEKIRVQFIPAELDCPGLYYSITADHDGVKSLGCVFPGCIKE